MNRWAGALGGGALVVYGLKRGSITGAALSLLGAEFVARGVTGQSPLYRCLGIDSNTARRTGAPISYQQGIRIDEAITIDRPVEEIYQFWRRFDNLPYFMEHLQSVSLLDDKRSHWMAKAPAGKSVEWDAEVVNEVPNEMIGWRSAPGSEIDTAGSVHFKRAPAGRGTEVRVELQYIPPAGILGALVAKLFGEEPQQQIREDLRHLKQIMECGEIPTIAGQPAGPKLTDMRRSAQLSAAGKQQPETSLPASKGRMTAGATA